VKKIIFSVPEFSKITAKYLLKALKIMGHSEYQTTADIYTHLDQEMMQATAEDLADVFKTVDTAARKGRWQKRRRLPDSVIIQFPAVGY